LIDIAGGGTPKTGNIDFWNGEIPFFTPKDVGTPYAITTEKHITEMGLEHCNSALYPINTVFVTARGTIGKISISGVPMAMNQSCYALLGKGISQILVYFYARAVIRSLQHKANGAVFDTIVTRDFETENICEFDDSTIASFVEFSESIYQKILNNTIETDTLIKLRDTMLPQLLSGKLDISNIHI